MSLLVVLLVSSGLDAWLGIPLWAPPLLWLVSGALVFHRPTEDFLARHLLRLHRPVPAEYARLAPVWSEVTARAGIDSRTYDLWIEDSEDLNAYAAAGNIVGVTRFALDHLPTSQKPPYSPTNWATTPGVTSGPRCWESGTHSRADWHGG